jgi:hypothetical protein
MVLAKVWAPGRWELATALGVDRRDLVLVSDQASVPVLGPESVKVSDPGSVPASEPGRQDSVLVTVTVTETVTDLV